MNKISKRTGLVAVATAAATIAAGSLAYAYWTTNGTGSAAAAAGAPVTLTVTSTGITGLYPTQKTTVPVTVANTNGYNVALNTVTLTGVTPTGTGCAAGDITLDSTATGVSGSVFTPSAVTITKTGSGSGSSTILNVPIVAGNLDNLCQGAGHSFTLAFTVSGQSAA